MSASLSPVRLMSASSMRFGVWRPLLSLIQGGARASTETGWLAEWTLRREPSAQPGGAVRVIVLGLVCSLLVAAVCWMAGARHLLPHVLAQLLCLSLAWRLHARHAADHDAIAMKPSLVRVEQHRGGHVRRVDFHPRWVRVEPALHDGSLVRLSGQGRSVVVGGFVPRACRPQLAEEFRWALRHLDD
jgi:uncharacterized membrane protein